MNRDYDIICKRQGLATAIATAKADLPADGAIDWLIDRTDAGDTHDVATLWLARQYPHSEDAERAQRMGPEYAKAVTRWRQRHAAVEKVARVAALERQITEIQKRDPNLESTHGRALYTELDALKTGDAYAKLVATHKRAPQPTVRQTVSGARLEVLIDDYVAEHHVGRPSATEKVLETDLGRELYKRSQFER